MNKCVQFEFTLWHLSYLCCDCVSILCKIMACCQDFGWKHWANCVGKQVKCVKGLEKCVFVLRTDWTIWEIEPTESVGNQEKL